MTDHLIAEVEEASVEFALVVEGPWITLFYRFGDAGRWLAAERFNWHLTPEDQRVVPSAVELSPETYSRLWSAIWISLTDAKNGKACARRAVAICPEFTFALHEAIRQQTLQTFDPIDDHVALRVSDDDSGPTGRAIAMARCGHALTSDVGSDDQRDPANRGRYEASVP